MRKLLILLLLPVLPAFLFSCNKDICIQCEVGTENPDVYYVVKIDRFDPMKYYFNAKTENELFMLYYSPCGYNFYCRFGDFKGERANAQWELDNLDKLSFSSYDAEHNLKDKIEHPFSEIYVPKNGKSYKWEEVLRLVQNDEMLTKFDKIR